MLLKVCTLWCIHASPYFGCIARARQSRKFSLNLPILDTVSIFKETQKLSSCFLHLEKVEDKFSVWPFRRKKNYEFAAFLRFPKMEFDDEEESIEELIRQVSFPFRLTSYTYGKVNLSSRLYLYTWSIEWRVQKRETNEGRLITDNQRAIKTREKCAQWKRSDKMPLKLIKVMWMLTLSFLRR